MIVEPGYAGVGPGRMASAAGKVDERHDPSIDDRRCGPLNADDPYGHWGAAGLLLASYNQQGRARSMSRILTDLDDESLGAESDAWQSVSSVLPFVHTSNVRGIVVNQPSSDKHVRCYFDALRSNLTLNRLISRLFHLS
jgi:hypothetical protein